MILYIFNPHVLYGKLYHYIRKFNKIKILHKYTKNYWIYKIYAFSLNITAEAGTVRIISDVI